MFYFETIYQNTQMRRGPSDGIRPTTNKYLGFTSKVHTNTRNDQKCKINVKFNSISNNYQNR